MDITAVSFVTLDGLKEFLKKCKETFALKEDLTPVQVPIVNKVGTDYISKVLCWKSGHVVQVEMVVKKIAESGDVSQSIALTGFPRPVAELSMCECPFNSSAIIRWALTKDGNFGWHYVGAWETSGGHELQFGFTYLTNE